MPGSGIATSAQTNKQTLYNLVKGKGYKRPPRNKIMFTGIVEGLARVRMVDKKPDFSCISIDLARFAAGVKKGDSISVNGVCLTVTKIAGGMADFDIMHETLKKTDLGYLKAGSRVNIERSARISDRIGGHIVLGHVDGIGRIEKKEYSEDNCFMWICVSEKSAAQMVEKGSVAIDGVSMTIVDLTKNSFSVGLIPHTLRMTTLGFKDIGDKVNIEVDYVSKLVKKYVEAMR